MNYLSITAPNLKQSCSFVWHLSWREKKGWCKLHFLQTMLNINIKSCMQAQKCRSQRFKENIVISEGYICRWVWLCHIIYYQHFYCIKYEISNHHKPLVRPVVCQFGAFWVLVLVLSQSEPAKQKHVNFHFHNFSVSATGFVSPAAKCYFRESVLPFLRIAQTPPEIGIQLVSVCRVKNCEQLTKSGAKVSLRLLLRFHTTLQVQHPLLYNTNIAK